MRILLFLLLALLALPVQAQQRGDVVVTELLANPGGTISDANGEWIELFNATGRPVDLQGWAVRDSAASGVRPFHVIASPLVIPAYGFVVIGNTTNTTNNGGVPVSYAYGATMAFANSLDRFQLFAPNQTTLITEAFFASAAVSAQNGISRERLNVLAGADDMDGTGWADATVTSVYGQGGRGTPAAIGQTAVPAAPLSATATTSAAAGYRLVSPPVRGLTVGTLAGLNLVQGLPDEFPNATGSNLFTGYSGNAAGPANGFVAPASKKESLRPGRGALWYMYDAGGPGPGAQEGTSRRAALPLTLQAQGYLRDGSVGTTVAAAERQGATDDFYLLGNPFNEPFDLSGIATSSGTLSNVFQFFVPGTGPGTGYILRTRTPGTADGSDDDAAVWDGFFAEFTTAPTLPVAITFAPPPAPPFSGASPAARPAGARLGLALDGTTAAGATTHDEAAALVFTAGATDGWDADDASKRVPLTGPAATLAPVGPNAAGVRAALAQRSLPLGPVAVPLAFTATDAGTYTVSAAAPAGWEVTLTDAVTGTVAPLGAGAFYTFESAATAATERFVLTVTPRGTTVAEADASRDAFVLSPVTPNPSAESGQAVLRVSEPQAVRAEVFDVLGRRVQVVFEGTVAAGAVQALATGGGSLSAGTYVLRVVGERFTATRTFHVAR